MQKRLLLTLIFILALTVPTAQAANNVRPDSPRVDFAERRRAIAEIMEAATVWVVVDNPRDYSTGSGFIVGEGYIITNAHVTDSLKAGGSIYVLNEKITARQASIVGSIREDSRSAANVKDLALLRFDPPKGTELPVLSFNFDVKRMDRVSAWGYPGMATQFDIRVERLGKENINKLEAPPVIYTEGAVNAIVRGRQTNSILHSASIAGGNSGGPLINNRGEVVGINTWGHTEEDEGAFLNGAQLASDIVNFLAENGVTPRLAAGQQPMQITAQSAPEAPAIISGVVRHPAQSTRDVTIGGYTMKLPRGWSVGEQEEDTLVVGNDDNTVAVALYLGDLGGVSLRRMASELSRTHEGSSPELDDDLFIFTFRDEDGDIAAGFVGEGDEDDSFFVVYIFGDFENPGIQEFLDSMK